MQDFLTTRKPRETFAVALDYSVHKTFSQGLAEEVGQVSDEDIEPGCRSSGLSSQFSRWNQLVPNQRPDWKHAFIWCLEKTQKSRNIAVRSSQETKGTIK